MGQFGMGQSVPRVEDEKLLTGTGEFTDDIQRENQLWMAVVRSPVPHADLKGIDASAALDLPGVTGVYTNNDLKAEGYNCIPTAFVPEHSDGTTPTAPHRPILANDRIRYVGEPVAVVVAETKTAAWDAVELIELDYVERDAVVLMPDAIKPDAPSLYDGFTSNTLAHWSLGDREKTEAAFNGAARVVSLDLVNSRVAPTALEPRSVLAEYDTGTGQYTLTTGSQGSQKLKAWITSGAVDVDPAKLRVICPDVGGGFGMKNFLFAETLAALYAAKVTGRPVKWTADRNESFLNDTHGRDQMSHAELAIDETGKFLAIRVSSLGGVGAYLSQYGALIPTSGGCGMLCGAYAIETAYVDVKVVFTNTAPLDAYRGAGRPEAAYLLERLVDKAARELDIAPDELRRRNFISPQAFPHALPLGKVYDSGEYQNLMDAALDRAGYASFPERRTQAKRNGRLRGLGMSYYVEACGGGPTEYTSMSVTPEGRVQIKSGSQNNGQGHATIFSQLAADTLGADLDHIDVLMGDTDVVPQGMGVGGSRALTAGGTMVVTTSEALIENGKKMAANLLEAAEVDIEFQSGAFRITGTDRTASLAAVAQASFDDSLRPEDVKPGLETLLEKEPGAATFPNGCHVCEVEVDPETGVVAIIKHTIQDDIGRILNPMTLKGQIIGGAIQGIGQALCEEAVYDGSGQLVTGSFMDYSMPRADTSAEIDFAYTEVPSPNNRLGVKGAGEAGTIGSTPAVVNAVIDALAPLGITEMDMPLTPLKVWQAIQDAGGVQSLA